MFFISCVRAGWLTSAFYLGQQKKPGINLGALVKLYRDRFKHNTGGTRIIPLDISKKLNCEGLATSPALCANFVRIVPGEELSTNLGHVGSATLPAEAAVKSIKISDKYIDSAVIIQKL